MAFADYTVSFIPTLGSLGTLIEYKDVESSVWLTPTDNGANPTTLNYYTLSLETGKSYNIRVSAEGNCTKKYVLTIISVEGEECCPPTYTLSLDGTFCYKTDVVAVTSPTSPENAVSVSNNAYSTDGSWIYDAGYNVNGTGTSTKITILNNYWKNGVGNGSDGNSSDGPLNRCGVWAVTTTSNQDVGFSVCIDILEEKTYYVGFGSDNYGILRVNGATIIQQDATALDTQYSLGGSPFKVWHIYPLTLQAGSNVVEILGHNVSSAAAIGAQIYDNTSTEISSATSNANLNFIFNSADFVGQPIQIGTSGIGYECPSGYSLVLCDGPAYCTRTLTTSTIPC